ncbi:MAG: TonB-dependent receptor [Bacteroidota bacterium]
MRNLILLILIMFLLFSIETSTNAQSIELPDFVITGVQSVSIPTMKKNKSNYIPVISEEFLTPSYDVEDFALTDYSNPIKKELELYDEPHGYNGLVKIGAGSQTLPTGDFYFNKSIGQFLFDTHIWGSNIREYIPNAGYNTSGGKVNFNYFINKRNLPFHGLAINLDAAFYRESYKLYGSISPTQERENNFSNFNLSFLNRLQKTLNYGLKISGKNVRLTKDDVKEGRYDWNGFIRYDFGAIAGGVEGFAANQEVVKNNGLINKYNYFGTNVFVEFVRSNVFFFKVGLHYSKQSSNSLFSPFVHFSFDIKKEVTLFASYSGESKFITVNNFISQNRFYKTGSVDNVFQKTSSDITGAIKYEFNKVFELKGGVAFQKFSNYLYFEDNLVDGIFDVNIQDDVTRAAIFFNLIFDADRLGKFFADIELQNVKASSGKRITYTPSFTTDISYTYRFVHNLLGRLKLSYFNGIYADMANTIQLPNYFNLSFYLRYNLLEELALTATIDNLINKHNYIYKNYREKPFDIIFGIEYNW